MTDYSTICTPELFDWVERNINADPAALRLKWRGKMPWVDFAIMQVECRKKARKKLPEELGDIRFIFPTLISAEQSTSDTLAEFHATLICEGDSVVDLTCGLGIDTFHLATRASRVNAIDINPDVACAIAYNASVLGRMNVTAIAANCMQWLNSSTDRFDTAFIDPARRGEGNARIYRLSDCIPDVTSNLQLIANHANRLVVKMSPLMDISQTLRELPQTTDIYVVGNASECKELVACIDFRVNNSQPIIHTWSPNEDFSFTLQEEADAEVTYGEPHVGDYLCEPSPVAMKAAPYRLLSSRFNLAKLHPNSHLYVSPQKPEGFPGSCRRIVEMPDYTSHNIKDIARRYKKINVAARNFGISADALRTKLKVKDGGDMRLIGTTLTDGRRIMLILE